MTRHQKTRIYKSVPFARFARKEGIDDRALREAVRRMEQGRVDADLGGGVIKQRVARPHEGKSGGFRTIILCRMGDRAIFVHGYAKKDLANLSQDEVKAFKKAAAVVLNLPEAEFLQRVAAGSFLEVHDHEEGDKIP